MAYVWRSVRADGDKKQAATRLRAGETWQDHDLVFCTGNGKPLAAGNIRRAFRMITNATRRVAHARRCGKPHGPARPTGNRLEKLTGDRAGQYSIRINQQPLEVSQYQLAKAVDVPARRINEDSPSLRGCLWRLGR